VSVAKVDGAFPVQNRELKKYGGHSPRHSPRHGGYSRGHRRSRSDSRERQSH